MPARCTPGTLPTVLLPWLLPLAGQRAGTGPAPSMLHSKFLFHFYFYLTLCVSCLRFVYFWTRKNTSHGIRLALPFCPSRRQPLKHQNYRRQAINTRRASPEAICSFRAVPVDVLFQVLRFSGVTKKNPIRQTSISHSR